MVKATILRSMFFPTEKDLVDTFVQTLGEQNLLPAHAITREFSHRQGRADVIAVSVDGEVVAFEAKLTRWRDALLQAYRNTAFAHRSYVVLPWKSAERARAWCGEFERRGVGLCTVREGEILILHEAPAREPVQPWLSAAAYRSAIGNSGAES